MNLAPVDDKAHAKPVATATDDKLAKRFKLGIWVSAPTSNHNFTTGILRPTSQVALRSGLFIRGKSRAVCHNILDFSGWSFRQGQPRRRLKDQRLPSLNFNHDSDALIWNLDDVLSAIDLILWSLRSKFRLSMSLAIH